MSVYRNAASSFLFQLSATLLNSVLNIFIARMLGPELLGNYQVFLNTTMFLTAFLSLGVDVAILRSTATADVPIPKLSSAAWVMVAFITLGTLTVVSISTYIEPIKVRLPRDFLIPEAYNHYLFMMMMGIMSFCYAAKIYFIAIVNGKQLFLELNILQTIVAGVNLLAYSGLLWAQKSGWVQIPFEQFFIINTVFLGLTSLTAVWIFYARIKKSEPYHLPNRKEWGTLFRFSGGVYIGVILQFLNYRMVIWFLNAYVSKSELGIFSQALQLTQMLWILSSAATSVLLPFISTLPPKEGERYVQVFCRTLFWATLALGIVGAVLSFWLVPILYGPAYYQVAGLVAWMVWGFVMYGCSRIITSYMLRNDQIRWLLEGNALGVIANVICNLILIPKYGIVGGAWALNVSFTVACMYIFIRYCAHTKVPLSALFWLTKDDITAAVKILRKK